MKRDFQEEYQNYIESDMPDLWSRIEPNLKEKNGKSETEEAGERESSKKKSKALYFIKRAVPVAACLCALVIGVGVMRISKSNFTDMDRMKSASEEPSDAGMAYSAEPEAAAEEETAMWDESFDDAAMNESAAPAEAPMQGMGESADMDEAVFDTSKADSTEWGNSTGAGSTKVNGIGASEEAVTVERAVLSGIAVASEEMQEEGYAYAYTFRLEDNSRLIVYLTNEQCRDLEEREVEIKRQAAYTLSVFPIKAGENTEDATVGESFLENLEKLP